MIALLRDDSRPWFCLGMIAVAAAVWIGYRSPAAGYELSIYASTPVAYWVALCGALVLSVVLVFSRLSGPAQPLGVLLGGFAMTTVLLTPVIRGYHYFGTTDSLSHLGTARDLSAGAMHAFENRYPVVHTLGSILTDTAGISLTHGLLLVVGIFIVCFFIFIPVTINAITHDSRLAYVGFFFGLLLLPLNHLSPSVYIHPTSQAVMYAPVLVFLFALLYREPARSYSIAFVVAATMFVMLHPQQAANLVLFFVTIALVQLVRKKYVRLSEPAGSRPVYSLVMVFALIFWLWVQGIPAFWSAVGDTVLVPFTETQAAGTTATRSVSLDAVGGSLPEVFVKLFLVQLLCGLLAGVLMIAVSLKTAGIDRFRSIQAALTSDNESEQTLLFYVVAGFFAVSSVFIVYIVGGISDQYFRHLGLMMVIVTMLTSIVVGRLALAVGRRGHPRFARRAVPLVLLVLLAASMPVVFASPYMYSPSDQVTEAQMSGYETSFEIQSPSIQFDDVRSSTSRYGNAIQGRSIPEEAYYNEEQDGESIPDHFADQQLRAYYNQSTYVPVTEADRIRDPVLWKGFRFSHEDFRYLDSEPGINKVQSNGGYDLYLVTPSDQVVSTPPSRE